MELKKRKHPRLNGYDYSVNGFYFVTICTYKRQPILSKLNQTVHNDTLRMPVGRGLAPAEKDNEKSTAGVTLTRIGHIAEEQLLLLENRYSYLKIDKYVILPDHIHAIFILDDTAGASPRPTVSDMICAYKSLTTIQCRKESVYNEKKLFQASYFDHIIRNYDDYVETWRYIDLNPIKHKHRGEYNDKYI